MNFSVRILRSSARILHTPARYFRLGGVKYWTPQSTFVLFVQVTPPLCFRGMPSSDIGGGTVEHASAGETGSGACEEVDLIFVSPGLLASLSLFGLIPHLLLLRLVRVSVHRADGRGKGVSTLSRVSRLGQP